MIQERDYETAFISENEIEELEEWRPLRLDGSEWGTPSNTLFDSTPIAYPKTTSHMLSCFNAASALAVIINRIISGVYSIRVA
jgi:hypothetical protein